MKHSIDWAYITYIFVTAVLKGVFICMLFTQSYFPTFMVTKLFSKGMATVRRLPSLPHLPVRKLGFIGSAPQFEKIRNKAMVDIPLTFVCLAGTIARPESFMWPLHQRYANKHIGTKYLTIIFSFFF